MSPEETVARVICRASCDGEVHICDRTPQGHCKPEKCRYWCNHLETAAEVLAALKEQE